MPDPITQQQFITAGESKKQPVFLEDVFRSDYYRGQNIAVSNGYGPNLADFGGMTWTKCTSATQYWSIRDTVRGANKWMPCSSTMADQTGNGSYQFLTTGQNCGTDGYNGDANQDFTSCSFRKAAGFFDIVTYTGTGVARTISHNLGSVPGAIVVKNTTDTGNWVFGHKLMNGGSNDWHYSMFWNAVDTKDASDSNWNHTAPTASVFSIGSSNHVNQSGQTYIAYLWASGDDAESQVFGREGEEEHIVKCGSYIGNGSSQSINVGFKPDWWIIKSVDAGGTTDWLWQDKYITGSVSKTGYHDNDRLYFTSNAGKTGLMRMMPKTGGINANVKGFHIESEASNYNANSNRYIYIAVRSPDKWVCRDGSTGVDGENGVPSQYFTTSQGTSAGSCPNGTFPTNFGPDVMYFREYVSSDNTYMGTRDCKTQTNGYTWQMNTTAQATAGVSSNAWYSSRGMHSSYNSQYQAWMWKKGPGCTHVWYQGNNQNATIYHDLGAAPELIIWKALDRSDENPLWHYGLNNGVNAEYYMVKTNSRNGQVDSRGDWVPNTASGLNPTWNSFKVGTGSPVNASNCMNVASLYRSVPGMSKVGYYQGNSSGLTITTGFQPRYMWLKRTNANDSRFYYLDTVRGWGAGNDQWLEFSDQSGQQGWDFGAPTATGFTLTGGNSHTNATGNNYIYYAHA